LHSWDHLQFGTAPFVRCSRLEFKTLARQGVSEADADYIVVEQFIDAV